MAMLRSFLLLFTIFFMGNAEVECPHRWSNFGDRCYKFFAHSVTWVTAERNCQSLADANLASVHDKLENDFLLSLLPSSSTRSWIGGHDGEEEGQWLWSDGSVYNFTNWSSGEPNNLGIENCGEINWTSNRSWNDASCSHQMGYICACSGL